MSFRPEDIDLVPSNPPPVDYDARQSQLYSGLVYELQDRLSSAEGELKLIKNKNLLIQAKIDLMKPYSDKVYNFVAAYCIGVFVILLLQGACDSFDLPPAVLGIIAGSTAVAALGLVGIVLQGLFGADKNTRG